MSMWLNLVKLTLDDVEKVKAKPNVLDAVFFDGGTSQLASYNEANDVFGTDYRTLSEVGEAMADGEELEEQDTWLAKSVGNGLGDELDYEFCYGPGFVLSPDEVKNVATGFASEAWYADAEAVDDDENIPGLVRFFETAAKEGKGVIGGVS